MAFNFNVNPVAINSTSKTVENLSKSIKLQDKTVEIDSNGQEIVTADSGYDGLGKVTINTDVPTKPEEVLTETITENGLKTFNPTSGSVFSSASITVNVPEKKIEAEKTVNITENKETVITPTPDNAGIARVVVTTNVPQPTLEENKTQTISSNSVVEVTPSAGNDGMKKATITVNVPEKKIEANKTQSIVTNGETVITPTAGNDGMAKVTVNVNVPSREYTFENGDNLWGIGKIKVCNNTYYAKNVMVDGVKVTTESNKGYFESNKVGIYNLSVDSIRIFGNSTFSECYDLQSVNVKDSSTVNNFTDFFKSCWGLQTVEGLDTSAGTDFTQMFLNCGSLRDIPTLDLSKGTLFTQMFYGCVNLTNVPEINVSLGTNFSGMFKSCSSLKTVAALDTSKGTTFDSMFQDCTNLESIEGIDFSSATTCPNTFFGFNRSTVLSKIILNGILNFSVNKSNNLLSYCADELDYDTIKS